MQQQHNFSHKTWQMHTEVVFDDSSKKEFVSMLRKKKLHHTLVL